MKQLVILIGIWSMFTGMYAQIEMRQNSTTVQANESRLNTTSVKTNNQGFNTSKKGLSTSSEGSGFTMKKSVNSEVLPTSVDRQGTLKNANLQDFKTNKAPKAFSEGEKIDLTRINKDEYFGEFKTTSKFLVILFKDAQVFDGDYIAIYNEDDIVEEKILLTASFGRIEVELAQGFNRIDILALNEGEGAPNTGHFVLREDTGMVLYDDEWYLSAGNKASFIIIKE